MDSFERATPARRLFTDNVIPQLLAWRREGKGGALVTLVGVDGSSPRRLGSQMAVNAVGEYLGFISSGCAEAAIVAEAVAAIGEGVTRSVRYGAGSKYMDVVLPCGSGIDVHFDPIITDATLDALQIEIGARRHASMLIDVGGSGPSLMVGGLHSEAAAAARGFVCRYSPQPRVVVAGRGINVDFVARLAYDLEWEVVVASPDEALLTRTLPLASRSQALTSPEDFDAGVIDETTAVVLMFHDHEWEPTILAKCAAKSAFYVGALGSRRTHGQRKELLAMLGCKAEFIDQIRSPVGLDIGARNPAEIALAVVAEILSLCPKSPV